MQTIRADEPLAGVLSLAVVRLARRLRGHREIDLVSLTQLSALNTMYNEGPMTPGALAATEQVKPPSMTRILASLADLDMIKRERHPTDGRQVIVTLSPAGEEVIVDELAARKAWLADRLAELSDDEWHTLRAALPVLGKIIDGPGPSGH